MTVGEQECPKPIKRSCDKRHLSNQPQSRLRDLTFLYIGTLLMFFNWILCFLTVFAVIMYHLQIVNVEEDFLFATFGNEYLYYKKKKFVAILAESDNFKFDGVMDMKIREVNEK